MKSLPRARGSFRLNRGFRFLRDCPKGLVEGEVFESGKTMVLSGGVFSEEAEPVRENFEKTISVSKD